MAFTVLITYTGLSSAEFARLTDSDTNSSLLLSYFPSHVLLPSALDGLYLSVFQLYQTIFAGTDATSVPNVLRYAKEKNFTTSVMTKRSLLSEIAAALTSCGASDTDCIVSQLSSTKALDFGVACDFYSVAQALGYLQTSFTVTQPGEQMSSAFPSLNFVANGAGAKFLAEMSADKLFSTQIGKAISLLKHSLPYLNIIDFSLVGTLSSPSARAAEQNEVDLVLRRIIAYMRQKDNLLVIFVYSAVFASSGGDLADIPPYVPPESFQARQQQISRRLAQLQLSDAGLNRSAEMLLAAGIGPAFASGRMLSGLYNARQLNEAILEVLSGDFHQLEELSAAESGKWFFIGCAVFGFCAICIIAIDCGVRCKKNPKLSKKPVDLQRAETRNFKAASTVAEDAELIIQFEV